MVQIFRDFVLERGIDESVRKSGVSRRIFTGKFVGRPSLIHFLFPSAGYEVNMLLSNHMGSDLRLSEHLAQGNSRDSDSDFFPRGGAHSVSTLLD